MNRKDKKVFPKKKLTNYGYEEIEVKSYDSELLNIINNEVDELHKNGKDIHDYLPYLYSIIDDFVSKKFLEIEINNDKNNVAINNYFNERTAALEACNDLIDEINNQILDVKSELDNVKYLYEKHNPLDSINKERAQYEEQNKIES